MRKLPPALILAATQVIVEGATFLRNIVLARIIGVENMGLAVAVAIGVRLFEMIGDFGLERWLVQVKAERLPRIRGAVHLLQAIKGVLLMAAAMAVAIPVTRLLLPEVEASVFALAAIAIGIRGFINYDYRERHRERDYRGSLRVEAGSNLLALLATAPIALWTRDYSAVAWASIMQALAMCLLSQWVARRHMSFTCNRQAIAEALRFGIPISCNALLMFLALQGDRLIVAVHFEPETLAGFALAAQLTLLPALAGTRFIMGFDLPKYAEAVNSGSTWQALLRKRLFQVTAVSGAMVLAFSTVGQSLVSGLYGPEFVTDAGVLELLALAAGIRLTRTVPSTMLVAQGRTPFLLACNMPRVLALMAIIWALGQGAGLFAVALIGVVSEATGLMIGLAALHGTDRPRHTLMHPTAGAS